jgi:glycosyltransferase involved in cell wall biosynthesis
LTLAGVHYSAIYSGTTLFDRIHKMALWRAAVRSLARNMFVIMQGEHIVTLAQSRGLFTGRPPHIIRWGVDPRASAYRREDARHQLGITSDARVALFFGELRVGKGVDYLMDAVSRLERGWLHVIIAGRENGLGFVPAARAASLGCSEDFTLRVGYVPENEMDVLFGAADCVVLPYRRGFEAESAVLASACGFGLPVIASDHGQFGHHVRESGLGLLFEPDDADALAAALRKFFMISPEERKQMASRARAYAFNYSWDHIGEQHLDLYRAAAGETLQAATNPLPRGNGAERRL